MFRILSRSHIGGPFAKVTMRPSDSKTDDAQRVLEFLSGFLVAYAIADPESPSI